jgi:Flp pilus assembly pilin Flp
MLKMCIFKRFLKEEQGRAKYEFLMLSGGVIITAATIFVLLTGVGSGAGKLGPATDIGGGFGGGGGGT